MQANFQTWVNETNSKLQTLLKSQSDSAKVETAIDLGNHVLSMITNEATRSPEDVIGENFIDLPNAERFDSWFHNHPDFAGPKSAFELLDGSEPKLQAKLYWLKKRSNALMAGAVHFTPNWEDAEWSRNENYKVGIDFFLSTDAKSFHIVLSHYGKLRVLELSERLTNTDIEVLEKWHNLAGTESLELLHSTIWDSFKLQSVNAKFYNGVADAFTELQEHLIKLGKPEQDAKMFSSRLLGRLIFIWFIRKMELISPKVDYFSPAGADQGTYYRMSLERLFFRTLNCPIEDRATEHDATVDLETPYLNGGLFSPRTDDWLGEQIHYPNEYFTRLYEHFAKFNFTTDESTPEYEQVAIDPEMLGRVFESLLASQIESTGEQARKAKGTFYTPREIVSFMCKEAVRKFLTSQDKGNSKYLSSVGLLQDKSDQEWANDGSNSLRDIPSGIRVEIARNLSEFKTLDPACGSGAYPLGLLQLLTQLQIRLDPRLDPYKLKLSILQNNIFGSDIEPMAIEISRLRSWLSLIVEETGMKNVQPLPNLDFNFVCADSLIPLQEADLFSNVKVQNELEDLRRKYFAANTPDKKKQIETKYRSIAQPDLLDNRGNQLRTFNPFDVENTAKFFDAATMFGIADGFDLVIGNPPYVAPKGLTITQKAQLLGIYNFADDLYSHFIFRGLGLLKATGNLSFITSKSYWTIQSKKVLRNKILTQHIDYIYDTANPFESALVDTAIISLSRKEPGKASYFYEATEDYTNPVSLAFDQNIFIEAVNNVFFVPTANSLTIFNEYNSKNKSLMDSWWPLIRTSGDKKKNSHVISSYVESLKPGDIALLGTIVDGGQGMATGNNGKYLAVLESSIAAENILVQRAERLLKVSSLQGMPQLPGTLPSMTEFLNKKTEEELVDLFESIKNSFGNDIFGKGFIYRLARESRINEVASMTENEKENGLKGDQIYVPYDKGDKDGNSWYLPTPFLIDWSETSVAELKASAKSKEKGASRFQNKDFYFKAGVSWILTLNENSEYLKARYREASVFDVNAMSIFVENGLVSEKFLTCLLNSYFIFYLQKIFINGTSAFQINDAKQLPLVIPSAIQLEEFERLFDRAKVTKEQLFAGLISKAESQRLLTELQKEVDSEVLKLYGLQGLEF